MSIARNNTGLGLRLISEQFASPYNINRTNLGKVVKTIDVMKAVKDKEKYLSDQDVEYMALKIECNVYLDSYTYLSERGVGYKNLSQYRTQIYKCCSKRFSCLSRHIGEAS